MSKIKIGINGFGRIGRAVARIALNHPDIELVAINTRKGDNSLMAYLLRQDSIYRTLNKTVEESDKGLVIDGQTVTTTLADTPENIPWGQYGVQIVVDATGAFTKSDTLTGHLRDTVKHVIVTAPAKDDTPTVVMGVNDSKELLSSPIISNASCTTNCAAPLFKVLQDTFGIQMGQMTTVHAYTMSQSMMDDANKEMDRSRAAVSNIIPSTSGAAKAVVKVLPALAGKIEVFAVRVPVPVGSASDLSVVLEKETTIEQVNEAYKSASEGGLKGILAYAQDLYVSSDIIGNPHSCVFDPHYTKVTGGRMVKVFGWYDNEWGYSSRVVELIAKMGKTLM